MREADGELGPGARGAWCVPAERGVDAASVGNFRHSPLGSNSGTVFLKTIRPRTK